ncbi:MAG: DUF2723 domain-containing protein [Saprospiraceae bacterium]|nr:DUF2723 domain-containing protein [Saprospiraceae bacterium]
MKIPFKKAINWTGLAVLLITAIVFYFSAERTGSLWDCGEFIAGAYKLEVVHPPGAPLFLLIGRMFTFLAEVFSNNPEMIAFSVNFLSCLATSAAAMLICWVTMYLGKLAMVGREGEVEGSQVLAIMGAGLTAGLATAFATSIWFSAVEGEVYAMSTFFTTLTLWAMVKWYYLPNDIQNDRWVIFAVYAAGLSIGVHLLSILTFPALALLYYFKKYKNHNLMGVGASIGVGLAFMVFIQKIILVGIPSLWAQLDLIMVNSFGLPVNSGVIPLAFIVVGIFYFLLRWATVNRKSLAQQLIFSAALVVAAFSTLGIVVIRANANTPINMNNPNNPFQLITYLNREQYGERPLMYGAHFDAPIIKTESKERYALDGDKYNKIDKKITPIYSKKDKMLMPRMGHADDARRSLYRRWMNLNPDPNTPLPAGRPSGADNIKFFWNYQVKWMYWRYFMWNFSGKQNGEQGYYPWDKSSGNWISGIPFLDNARLYDQSELTDTMVNHEGRNAYFMLPFLFGLLGMFYHYSKQKKDFLAILALFIITGIGIIVYSNQPPNEPRERDYVFAGSFFTYAIWIGLGVLAMFQLFASRLKLGSAIAAPLAAGIVLIAPILMGFQNFDDHSRIDHKGSRDYASNFLNSVEENSILFTYGDNDTYPLWYAQEVEGIRTDVRVVNLSLIAVDWYINQLRRKVNDSPAIKMTIPEDAIRGFRRSQYFIDPFKQFNNRSIALDQALRFAAGKNEVPLASGDKMESYWPSKKVYIPVRKNRAIEMGMVAPEDTSRMVDRMEFNINKGNFLYKGDAAILDIINSNIWDRPVYFAVTCQQASLLGIQQYTQLEGLALRIIPIKSAGENNVYGMLGNGQVAEQKVYENVMEKFRWGNFDKKKLFVDRSYTPSIQTQKVMILRTVANMIKDGNRPQAVDLLDKHFEAFPHMNFPFDNNTMSFLSLYAQAGAMDKAAPHVRTLATEFKQLIDFYESLDPADREQSFSNDLQTTKSYAAQLVNFVRSQSSDETLKNEVAEMLNPYIGGS